MPYASITRNDLNPLKRLLHRRRLHDALSLAESGSPYANIVDFGAGDGETCRRLAVRYPEARIWCYEPCEALRAEANEALRHVTNVSVVAAWQELPLGQCDLVLCLEVFEHLPQEQIDLELSRIWGLLREGGAVLVGVPLEVYLPALAKGMFRMTRRFGQFDARPGNILRAALGRPPRPRPVGEIGSGLPYHFHHLGFDDRRLRRDLAQRFAIQRTVCSPWPWLGHVFNAEVYYLGCKQASPAG